MGIRENLDNIQERINKALLKAGRPNDPVTLVAVSKYSTAQEVLEAAFCGQRVFAENRVQQLLEKWEQLEEYKKQGIEVPELTWHLIGHLQTNKVKYIVGKVALIHSVDSIRLAEEINRVSEKKGVITDILLEVNVSGEESKSGITPGEMDEFMTAMASFSAIRLKGLMTMAPKGAEEGELRKIFSCLYEKAA